MSNIILVPFVSFFVQGGSVWLFEYIRIRYFGYQVEFCDAGTGPFRNISITTSHLLA